MSDLIDYVLAHTTRGECKCGRCLDVGTQSDPTGHTADLTFFTVAQLGGEPETFRRLTREHHGEFNPCDPLDGKDHSYIELGGWLGDQGVALMYMGLGALLGVFRLLTPRQVFGASLPDDIAQQLAGAGYVTVSAFGGAAAAPAVLPQSAVESLEDSRNG